MKRSTLWLMVLLAVASAPGLSADDFSVLIEGVTSIGSHWQPGPLLTFASGWVAIASGDEDSELLSTLVAARYAGSGRVVAMQWNGINVDLDELDNKRFMVNTATWLTGSRPKTILLPRSHGEVFDSETISLWTSSGFTTLDVSGTLTTASLANAGFLWIPGSWQVPSYTESEITAIESFVNGGGGLLITGLGWSFPGNVTEFAPNVVGGRFGVALLKDGITDPTNNFGSPHGPIFHRIYPNATLSSMTDSFDTIVAAHRSHPADLDTAMTSDSGLRASYLRSLSVLGKLQEIFPVDAAPRTALSQFCADLVSDRLGVPGGIFLRKNFRYNQ